MSKRDTCTATAKHGRRCGAYPPLDPPGQTLCSGHQGLGVAAKGAKPLRDKGVAASRKAVGERVAARKMTALDHAAAVLERNGEELAGLIMAAARKGDWRAVAFLYERVYGKPVEKTEDVTQRELGDMSAEERARLRAALLEDYPHLRAA